MSILSRFFQFLSKTDRRVIIYCTDYSVKTQVTNGVFVLLTGMFAFLTSMYAVYKTCRDFRVAIPVALLYATVIVFIDREIVSAGSRWAALARLPLAFVIGLVISVPLEMYLFEKRINDQLVGDNYTASRAQLAADVQRYDGRIKTLEDEVAGYRNGMAEASQEITDETAGHVREGKKRTGLPGCGPTCEAAKAQLARNEQLLGVVQTELDGLRPLLTTAQTQLREIDERRAAPTVDDLMARYEAMEKVKAQSLSASYMAWGIRGLIILIEILPAFMKLIQRYNEYNFAVEAARRVNITRAIAIANDQIDQLTHNLRATPRPTLLEQLRENPFSS